MANDTKLTAVLEVKDNMTATIIKSKKSLVGLGDVAKTTSKTTDNIVKSTAKASGGLKELAKSADNTKKVLDGIKNNYEISISLKDMVSSPVNVIKTSLSGIAGKSYSAILTAKDKATDKVLKVKSEISSFAGKTYTAFVNVNTHMQPFNNMGNKLNEFTNGMLMPTSIQMAGAAGIGYGVYDTIKTSIDFDAQLSAIKALTPSEGIDGISRDGIMTQVRARAKELGQSTAFGNKEVAQGMTELIKAGISLKDVLGEASDAALNLATAGDLALPEAAEIMSTAMNTFGVKDATHAADILAGAANASATSVHEMKYSLSAVGIVAKNAGMNFEEVNTALALMATRGLKGSDAGTSLKSMLQQIEPASKPAIAAFEKLGLLKDGKNQFYDANGGLRSLSEIADILHESTKGLSEQELNSLYKDAFGSDGIRAAQILGEFTSKSVKDMYSEMVKVTAKEQSETMLDNLKGDIEQLGGAWENFQDTLMEGSATGGLRSVAQEMTELIQEANKLLENGLTFWGTFDFVTKPIRDLYTKAIEFNGMGSMVAGGTLFLGLTIGLKKFYNLLTNTIQKFKDLVSITKGNNLPDRLPNTLPMPNTKDLVVNAQNVYVNGKNTPSGGDVPTPAPSTPNNPNRTPNNKPSIWARIKDAFKTGLNYGGNVSKTGIALQLPFSIYDVYSASEGERGAEVSKAGGAIVGGWAGAKIGGATGAMLGSIIPGIGTSAGAIIGGTIGGISGSVLGSDFGDKVARLLADNNKQALGTNANGIYLRPKKQTEQESYYPNKNLNNSNIFLGLKEFSANAVQDYGNMQLQSTQMQIEGQKQLFESLKTKANEVWNSITDIVTQSGQAQTQSIQMQANVNKESWVLIQNAGIEAFEWVKNGWNEAVAWFDSNVYSPLKNLARNAGSGIADGINSGLEMIKSSWQGLKDWFNTNIFTPIKNQYIELKNSAPTPIQSALNFVDGGLSIGKNANGTMNWRGGLTEINERGGEIIDLPTGSRIYPAQTTERIINKEISNNTAAESTNINITGNTFIIRNDEDISRVAYELMSIMRQVNANFGGSY